MNESDQTTQYCLALSCPSEAGEVAAVVAFLDRRGGYIDELTVFDDKSNSRFFMRCNFHIASGADVEIDRLRRDFMLVAQRFDMHWQIHDMAFRPKVVIMVSKLDHCLADLLFRWRMSELKMQIVAIVSNHADLAPLAEAHVIPYHRWPVTPENKAAQEARLLDLVESSGTELVILARYMQVLSADTSRQLAGRAINIHHSFLPSFKGARPYHQAYARGGQIDWCYSPLRH